MVFASIAKNDLPREGKKLVFFMLWGRKTRFPHENNAISHRFFHGVSFFGLGLILGVFWGFLGALLGATWHPLGPQLGHFADSWRPGRPLGSLLGPIWCSVGSLCAFLAALWRKYGHQLDDFVSLGVRFGLFWVSGLWITFFCPIFGGHWLSLWILVQQVEIQVEFWLLNTFFHVVNGWILDTLFVAFNSTVLMALLVSMRCICWQRAVKCL